MPRKPPGAGLAEFDAETTSNPGPEEQARRAKVAEASEAGDLPATQLARYGADKESAAGTESLGDETKEIADELGAEIEEVAAAGSFFLDLEDADEFLRICEYGKDGAGKTSDLLHMANHGRVLVINAEFGVKKRALKKLGINVDNIKVWAPPDGRITRKNLEILRTQIERDLAEDPKSWFGVVFDSFTELTFVMLSGAQQRRVGRAIKAGHTNTDREFMDRADYGQAAKWLAELIRNWRTLPLHIGVTALMRRDVDEDTGKVMYGPATSPAVQNDLAAMMDVVMMKKGEDEDGPYRALIRTSGKYRAKDRYNIGVRVLAMPTFDRYFAYWNDEIDPAKDPVQKTLKAAKSGGKGSGDKELDTADELDAD